MTKLTHAEKWGQKPRGRAKKKREPGDQLSLAEAKTWGGVRKGAGRKKGLRPNVHHVARPKHAAWTPMHITLRCVRDLPSLRFELMHLVVKKAIADTRREDFRIVEYSVQDDHLHMIVEAESAAAVTRGMRSFSVRVALRINGTLRRSGRVWGDRYHRRDLRGPRQTRYALVYVLANHLKHGHEGAAGLLDPCSSGQWFQGWMHDRHAPPTEQPPGERPHTWLLREGWWKRGGGFIHLGERPRARTRRLAVRT